MKLISRLQSRISLRRNDIAMKYYFMDFNYDLAGRVPEQDKLFFKQNASDIKKEIKRMAIDQTLDKRLMALLCKAGVQNA